MSVEVTLCPGDDAEIYAPIRPLLEAAGADIVFDAPGPNATLEGLLASARRTGAVLVGPESTGTAEKRPIVRLRKALGVTHNLRPSRTVAGLPARCEGVDLLVVRETTEDIYAHLEHESIPGTFESLKVTTKEACERIARTAFELARAQGRKKVTIVHKANIMKLSDGMFLRTAREVAADFPDIDHEDVIVDALCMKLVLTPERFDVLVCGNLFGDIVADLCAGLTGGVSNAPSLNVAPDCTLFAVGHRLSAAEARANPVPLILPVVHLLEHVGQGEAATKLREALEKTLEAGVLPVPLGGELNGPAFLEVLHGNLA